MVKRGKFVPHPIKGKHNNKQEKSKRQVMKETYSIKEMKKGRAIFDELRKEAKGERIIRNIDMVAEAITNRGNIPHYRAYQIAQTLVLFERMKKAQNK